MTSPTSKFSLAAFRRSLFSCKKSNVLLIGFSSWKVFIRTYFPVCRFYILDKSASYQSVEKINIKSGGIDEVWVWGSKINSELKKNLQSNGYILKFIEDGFIRSIDIGAYKTPPLSLTIDSKAPYYDANNCSDLEALFQGFDFESEPDLLVRADNIIKLIRKYGISKYNSGRFVSSEELYGEKKNKRILVVGQVHDDASIARGNAENFSNLDMIKLARAENPDSTIIYKRHPDVIHGKRAEMLDRDADENIDILLVDDYALQSVLKTVDQVYTLTSLVGLEALIHGVEVVTTLGSPFYCGWGLTDDRQHPPNRKRKLSLNQLIAIAYLKYPIYFHPKSGRQISAEDALENIFKIRSLTAQR